MHILSFCYMIQITTRAKRVVEKGAYPSGNMKSASIGNIQIPVHLDILVLGKLYT